MKLRMVLKLMRPMLQEPSTSSTMSAFAAVLHWVSAERRWRGAVSETPGTPQTPTNECSFSFIWTVWDWVCGKVRKSESKFDIREERELQYITKLTQSQVEDVYTAECFTQHYATQIIHTRNTLCNSCHSGLTALSSLLLFLSLSSSTASRLGFSIQRRIGPVVFSGWHWGCPLQQQDLASLTLWYTRSPVTAHSCSRHL